MKKPLMLPGLLVLSTIFTIPCVSCQSLPNTELKEFQFQKEPAHFSFLYPVEYQVALDSFQGGYGFITLTYADPENINTRKLISIHLYGTTSTIENITSTQISDLNDEFPNFKLIKKKYLGGFKAQQFNCTYEEDITQETEGEVKIGYLKEVVTVHNNVVWTIFISSLKDQMKDADIDLDHIIKTFKILD